MNALRCPCQFPDSDTLTPRFREAGDVTFDRANCDGRVEDRWLGLQPREFALLWRLAEQPGTAVTCQQLLAAVWRVHFETQSSAISLHMARLRGKLEPFGLDQMLAEHPDGGWYLDVLPDPVLRLSGA